MSPPSTASSFVLLAAEAGAAVAEAVDAEPLTVVPIEVCEVTVTVLVLMELPPEAADAALVLILLATDFSTLNTLLK